MNLAYFRIISGCYDNWVSLIQVLQDCLTLQIKDSSYSLGLVTAAETDGPQVPWRDHPWRTCLLVQHEQLNMQAQIFHWWLEGQKHLIRQKFRAWLTQGCRILSSCIQYFSTSSQDLYLPVGFGFMPVSNCFPCMLWSCLHYHQHGQFCTASKICQVGGMSPKVTTERSDLKHLVLTISVTPRRHDYI